MELKAQIVVKENSKMLVELFQPELIHLQQERSRVTIVQRANNLIVTIHAKDSVALRSSFNGITKLITVFEKAQELKNHDK